MTKYYGKIGFIKPEETAPGVWIEKPIEKKYSGDIIKNVRRWDTRSDGINDNLNLNNSISIIADDFILENTSYIKYVELMGSLWDITMIDIQRPRLILTVGGVYNGPEPESEFDSGAEDSTPEDIGGDSGDESGILPTPGDSEDEISLHSL